MHPITPSPVLLSLSRARTVTLVPRLAFDYPPPPVPAAELKKQKTAAAAAGAAFTAPAWQRCIVYGRAVEAGLRCGTKSRITTKTHFGG